MVTVLPNMQAHEDLAAMFSKNMILDPATTPKDESKIIYISQHYNHSAHLASMSPPLPVTPQPQGLPRPASEPPQPEYAAMEVVLRSHGVDTSALSASQLQLFKTAEQPQQRRLVELWRASPPTNSNDNPTLAWSFTTIEQEETLARMRHEQRMASGAAPLLSLDGTPPTPVQTSAGTWVPQSQHYMEPYMASGYEDMARREYEASARAAAAADEQAAAAAAAAFDRPKDAYAHFGTSVGGPTYSHHSDPAYLQARMEDQYGRMMGFRNEDEEML